MEVIKFFNRFRMKEIEPSDEAATMEVIGVGLSRCGTLSLAVAFEGPVLNAGPTLHMARILDSSELQDICLAAQTEKNTERRHKLIRQLTKGCRSGTDWPIYAFTDDLMDIYPDAKIVLNHRPGNLATRGEAWAKSCEAFSWGGKAFSYWICFTIRAVRKQYMIFLRSYDTLSFKTGLVEPGKGKSLDWIQPEFYDKYYDWVRKEAAKRNREVFEWDPTMGYEPLCKFLGKEVPTDGTEFPHINDKIAMKMVNILVMVVGLLGWGMIGGSVYVAARYGPSFLSHGLSYVRGFV